MTGFEPGDGWREVPPGPSREQRLALITDGVIDAMWTREAPVPPLPTEPYTVIRVTWSKGARKGAQDILIHHLGGWCDLEGTIYNRGTVAESITGWEPLAEPVTVEHGIRMEEALRDERRETAKAVLDRVMLTGISGPAVDQLYREFGVSS